MHGESCTTASDTAHRVDQMTLVDFIRNGHFERHIRQVRSLYAPCQSALIDANETRLDDDLDVRSEQTGLHLMGWLRQTLSEQDFSQHLEEADIVAPPLSRLQCAIV